MAFPYFQYLLSFMKNLQKLYMYLNWSYLQPHSVLRDSLNSLTCITLRTNLAAVKESTLVALLNDVLSHGHQGHSIAFSSFVHLTISLQKSCKTLLFSPYLPQPRCTAAVGAVGHFSHGWPQDVICFWSKMAILSLSTLRDEWAAFVMSAAQPLAFFLMNHREGEYKSLGCTDLCAF